MADRREFRRATKAAAWERCGGACEGCARKFADGDCVEFDHIVPDALRKNADLANCQVLCTECHKAKTKGDITTIAKSVRIAKKFNGTFRIARHIVPGSKASRFRKSLNGKVTIREKAGLLL